jgi:ADP-heptose:LPS heptosyltransferase
VFTAFSQSALPAAMLAYLAGIPLRLARCRENAYHLLTDRVSETEPEVGIRHEVRRQLDLVGVVGRRTEDERLSLSVPDDARSAAADVLSSAGIDVGAPWVVVHPGATAPSRRYPAEAYAAAADVVSAAGFGVVFTGSRDEAGLVEAIRGAMRSPSASLAGRLDLRGLAAVIQAAPVALTNNTGPAHIAAAVGTPVVDVYALTNPQHAPWKVPSRVLFHDVECRNCFKSVCPEGHHLCLRGVPPATVAAAVVELYERRTPAEDAASADGSGGALVPAGP